MTDETEEGLSAQRGTLWFAALVTEYIAIFIINAFTLIAFARNRQLRKRSTYLLINLTVTDLLVGAVTGPLKIYRNVFKPGQAGFSWQEFLETTFYNIFPAASLANLSSISLERLHATLYPFRHCLIGRLVYYKIIIYIWLLSLLLAIGNSFLFLYEPAAIPYAWASYIVLTLLTLTVSYVIITVKVKSNPPPQHSGSVVADRKLSVTLFIVTAMSMITILPWAIWALIPVDTWNQLPHTTEDRIKHTVLVLYYTNSIVNPLVYTVRMQQFRKAVKELICIMTPESRRVHSTALQAM